MRKDDTFSPLCESPNGCQYREEEEEGFNLSRVCFLSLLPRIEIVLSLVMAECIDYSMMQGNVIQIQLFLYGSILPSSATSL